MTASREKPSSLKGELKIIRRIRMSVPATGRGALRLGIGDDCALLKARPGEEIAVTTDLSIEGRHFVLACHPPESVGHRTAARGLSDLAAMGARPLAMFLSLGLPEELTRARGKAKPWMERFYDGLLALAGANNTPLAGGDLAESPHALADVVLVGAVPAGRALLRSGARPGDALYMTGAVGGAAAGLERLKALATVGRPMRIRPGLEPVLTPHLYPQPRIPQGLWLRSRRMATAAIDLSDGLSTDLAHLCEESGVGAEVETEALPVARGATMEQALHGGEDYELLFSARAASRMPRSVRGVPIARIGRIVRLRPGSPRVLLRTPAGTKPLEPRGWEHFSRK